MTAAENPALLAPEARASWRYTWMSLAAAGAFLHLLLADSVLGFGDGRPKWPLVAAAAVSLAAMLMLIPRLRHGFDAGFGDGAERVRLLSAAAAALVAGGALALEPALAGDADAVRRLLGGVPLMYSAAIVGCLLRRPGRIALAVVTIALAVAAWWATGEAARDPGWLLLALSGWPVLLLSVWAWEIVRDLDVARRAAGELAVARERLRFASELHDVQGHTLQVLALKTELAERLLDADPAAARAQLRDARELAADALGQTREIARGYRRRPLDDELRNAADVLEAAGARTVLELVAVPEERAARELFGDLLRESTTNIIRHAPAADLVEVRLDADAGWRMRVRNDGADAAASGDAAGGSGLRDLARRFEEAGGALAVEHDDHRFTVTGRMPR